MCSYYFRSVWVAEWPPFWKELLTRLTLCSLYILTNFEGWIWVLIVSVPDLCIFFLFLRFFFLKNDRYFDRYFIGKKDQARHELHELYIQMSAIRLKERVIISISVYF